MQVFVNPEHARHHGRHEMFRGRLVPCVEGPDRVEHVLAELSRRGLSTLHEPAVIGIEALQRVHSLRYLQFLQSAWDDWVALDSGHAAFDLLPSVWPAPGMRRELLPQELSARVGLFAFDAGSPITAGTWAAARSGAACAVSAAQALLAGETSAFALTRPPGHHAGADFYGGYCFLNNSALAAQALRDGGAARVAIVDVDYHHGNGTQSIFYERDDVLTVSVHGDPRTEYPFYLGHADERGAGAGEGFNLNLPLPRGTGFDAWRRTLRQALQAVADFRPGALVVALGLDTFEADPISGFTLRGADYLAVGADIAASHLPTVFVFEGGYAVDELGVNAANVLEGFLR
ncbi:MAG: histone deacetylase family protein [Burkholderiaceae bacterium]|jgi:acetoin utilization deacetylase AcuC-like enzyme|nr:histone deacetylase family protein [Burkholderiaceae bacterium]